MSHLFCFGLGYTARCLARRLAAKGWTVTATATNPESFQRVSQLGFRPVAFDGRSQGSGVGDNLTRATHVLVSAPPDDTDPVLRWHADELAGAADVAWIGYLSTVGVYGDHNGGWVDEMTPPTPLSDRSRRRLEAENAWLAFGEQNAKRVDVFRLAGIYGPGRSAIDDLRQGKARRIVKPGQVFNRIHVEDIATTVEAALARQSPHSIYNVTDDEPAASDAVLVFAAELLGMTPPPALDFATADLSPMARSFYAECKRVSNRRLKTELGVELAFPTYREGLRALANGSH
jgi:nucleoside-diphosphate-sugar epimerase